MMAAAETTIGVCIACYNRREKTLDSLERLLGSRLPAAHSMSVYLVDDASPDGTGAAVRTALPAVNVFQGTGSLFWGGGMRRAFAEAMRVGHDYYLWLNDDVSLYSDSVERLIEAHRKLSGPLSLSILVGATRDEMTGELTYGGYERSRISPIKFQRVHPSTSG